MKRKYVIMFAAFSICGLVASLWLQNADTARGPIYRSPLDVALSPSAKTLYVSDHTAGQVVAVNVDSGITDASVSVKTPTGIAVAPDGASVYVASKDNDQVIALDPVTLKNKQAVAVRRAPAGLTISPDGSILYACEQFANTVAAIDTYTMKVIDRYRVTREPRFAALADDKTLIVANQLPDGSNLDDDLGACVDIIDLSTKRSTKVQLARGATDVGQVVVSADGKYAFVIHVLARWLVPPTQLDRGWIATNALTVIDIASRTRLNTCLIDDLDRGAANGYGLALSPDGQTLYTTQAGTNETQIINVDKLIKLMAEWPKDSAVALEDDLTAVYRAQVRKRVQTGGIGPRGVTAGMSAVYIANYFSGDISCMDPQTGKVLKKISIGNQPAADDTRQGEIYFNSALACFQQWQSCATCHPDARTDGLAWDLLNDGIGNPKNAKSMLLSDQTPPVMAHGVRDNMDVAIAAGFKYIQFHVPTQEELDTVHVYLKTLVPERSPYLRPDGTLTASAKRGKVIFNDPKVGCATCHPEPLFTDLQAYSTDTLGPYDVRDDFDTPTLIEVWRTAPYLHDGSVVEMEDVFIDRNKEDKHGVTSHLTRREMRDLVEYVLSL